MKYSKLAKELKSIGWNLKIEIEPEYMKEFVEDILIITNEELDTAVNNFKELVDKNYKEYERAIQELKQTLIDTQQNRDRILENDREIIAEKNTEIDSLRNIIRNNDQEYQKKIAKLNHENEQLIAKPASKVLKMQERILELELDQKATKEREELRERTMVALAEKNAEYAKEIPININNLSLSELKNLQKDIEKKISEEENKYVDFTNVPIHQLIDVRIYEESNLHRKALYLSDFYNWELIKDNLGELCLLPTKKVK